MLRVLGTGEGQLEDSGLFLRLDLKVPAPATASHLQHPARDVLLTAVTADAKLGVIIGLAVGQPVPEMRQPVRRAWGHPLGPQHATKLIRELPKNMEAWQLPPTLRGQFLDR